MKSTKNKLLSSIATLCVCFAMLIGSTYAWFTDSASTGVNKIQAGNLDIEAYYQNSILNPSGNDVTIDMPATFTRSDKVFFEAFNESQKLDGNVQIINEATWEPGKVGARLITVKNKGNLDAKIKLDFITTDEGLESALWFDFVMVNTDNTTAGRFEFRPMSTLQQTADQTGSLSLPKESELRFILVYGMYESAGNQYQNKSFSAKVIISATQLNSESDSFDNQYDKDAEYPSITTGATLNEVFSGANIDFGYGNTSTESVTLDGKGVAFVSDWTDAWVNSDTTIKGVTFMNGAVFSAKTDNVTITLENCTFYACDQSKLTYTGNNSLTNSGAGMCLNLEKSSRQGVKFIVKNCTFVGENDNSLPVDGPRYNADGTIHDMKKRGHAIALDAICGGGDGTLDSLLIEGCVINGVRGNAIQLYGKTGDITIKDTQINSWAMNNSGVGFAIRGDYPASGRTLTIQNVYFGLDEQSGNFDFGHVKVGSFSGNTDGSEMAGTYSK